MGACTGVGAQNPEGCYGNTLSGFAYTVGFP
jgi:hypothetical protein